MRKLFTLALALALVPVPLSSAAAETLENQDLHDYLDFEVGSTWEYDVVSNNYFTEEVNEITSSATQTECDETEDCYGILEGENESFFNFEDNVVYSYQNGENGFERMTLEDFESELTADEYEEFGFSNIDEGAVISCETNFEQDYFFQNKPYDALTQTCAIELSTQGSNFTIDTEETLLKGLGSVSTTLSISLGSVPYYSFTQTLTDSSLIVVESPFSDVEITDTNFDAIEYLYYQGVFSGYEDGTFKPDNTVNRAELLKILVEGSGVTPDEEVYKNCFSDVETDWYAKYVCYAKEEGWVSGYPDGSFKPADPVNKVEALKMLLLSQDIELEESYTTELYADVNAEDWFALYVETAKDLGILEENGQYFHPDDDKYRKGIAENLYRLLTY